MEKQVGKVSSNDTNNYKQQQQQQQNSSSSEEDEMDLRRGPWTVEEDFTLINYIAHHGEGRWNSLARCAGLKRTGKSCRLRWLNYLRPDVRRGNITLEEQLLILELHSRWGNRWSKIAQHLPGRTDNEIKNYWRTRVQKHAKQLKCDVNSKQFKDTMRYLWMPRLVERIQAAAGSATTPPPSATTTYNKNNTTLMTHHPNISHPENSSDSFGTPVSDFTESYNTYPIKQQGNNNYNNNNNNNNPENNYYPAPNQLSYGDQSLSSPTGYFDQGTLDFMEQNFSQWMDGGDHASDSLWSSVDDDMWFNTGV